MRLLDKATDLWYNRPKFENGGTMSALQFAIGGIVTLILIELLVVLEEQMPVGETVRAR